jgi:hypothetical protein
VTLNHLCLLVVGFDDSLAHLPYFMISADPKKSAEVKSKPSHFDPSIHEENIIRRSTGKSANEIGSRVARSLR